MEKDDDNASKNRDIIDGIWEVEVYEESSLAIADDGDDVFLLDQRGIFFIFSNHSVKQRIIIFLFFPIRIFFPTFAFKPRGIGRNPHRLFLGNRDDGGDC